MNFNKDQRFIRWFIIFAAVVITALILWNVSLFFDQLKQAERDRSTGLRPPGLCESTAPVDKVH